MDDLTSTLENDELEGCLDHPVFVDFVGVTGGDGQIFEFLRE